MIYEITDREVMAVKELIVHVCIVVLLSQNVLSFRPKLIQPGELDKDSLLYDPSCDTSPSYV